MMSLNLIYKRKDQLFLLYMKIPTLITCTNLPVLLLGLINTFWRTILILFIFFIYISVFIYLDS